MNKRISFLLLTLSVIAVCPSLSLANSGNSEREARVFKQILAVRSLIYTQKLNFPKNVNVRCAVVGGKGIYYEMDNETKYRKNKPFKKKYDEQLESYNLKSQFESEGFSFENFSAGEPATGFFIEYKTFVGSNKSDLKKLHLDINKLGLEQELYYMDEGGIRYTFFAKVEQREYELGGSEYKAFLISFSVKEETIPDSSTNSSSTNSTTTTNNIQPKETICFKYPSSGLFSSAINNISLKNKGKSFKQVANAFEQNATALMFEDDTLDTDAEILFSLNTANGNEEHAIPAYGSGTRKYAFEHDGKKYEATILYEGNTVLGGFIPGTPRTNQCTYTISIADIQEVIPPAAAGGTMPLDEFVDFMRNT